jgi:hypothetical protein
MRFTPYAHIHIAQRLPGSAARFLRWFLGSASSKAGICLVSLLCIMDVTTGRTRGVLQMLSDPIRLRDVTDHSYAAEGL